MENKDKIIEAMIKVAEKLKAAAILLKTIKDAVHKEELELQIKAVIIEAIIEHDKLIQVYVKEDQPKSTDELNNLSIKEITEWSDLRTTYLKHLINKDTVN
jgi:hypothetical protein